MTEHRVSLFFDFGFELDGMADKLAALSLQQADAADWIDPGRLAGDALRPIGQNSIWEWTAWNVSPDLHPFVRALLNSSTSDQLPDQPLCLRRSTAAMSLLEGRYRGTPGERGGQPGFVLTLGAVPHLRNLSSAGPVLIDGGAAGMAVEVEIVSLTLHVFATGVGLVIPRLRLMPRERGADIPPELLIEIVPRLGDARRGAMFGWMDGWAEANAPRFELSTLLGRLVEPAGARMTRRERVHSHVSVVADRQLEADAARALAYRLSRHYSALYQPTAEFLGTVFVQPFEPVLHAASREGGCTLIRPGTAPAPVEFLETWLAQADAHVYFPLQVAAFHEYVALLGMAQGAAVRIDPGARNPQTIAALRNLSHRFLLFRLRYRLQQVSSITVHELAYAGTVQALGIEQLSTKISRDLVEVERRLRELAVEEQAASRAAVAARERARERKYAVLAWVGAAALAYITMASFADHLSDFLKNSGYISEDTKFWIELAGQAAGIGLFVWSFIYTMGKHIEEHGEMEHIIEHQAVELRLAHPLRPEPSAGDHPSERH